MTLIIGIKCKDGVVLGSDGAATYGVMGQQTIRQAVKKKIRLIGSQAAAGTSGSVGIGQRFAGEVDSLLKKGFADPTNQGKPKLFSQAKPHEAMAALREAVWRIIGRELEIAQAMARTLSNPYPVQSALSQSVALLNP